MRKGTGDRLRPEGIYRHGFGIIPKFVMHDRDLTLESKAIYAYLCALAGGGEQTFPYRETILRQLGMSKNTYYRHYTPLIEQGYLTVERPPERDGANIYTLVGNPKKLQETIIKKTGQTADLSGPSSRLRHTGLKSTGYGSIPRAVMTDERLSVKAKGLYAYFCSYCGAGDCVFPYRDHILYHLKISEPTYYKALNQLRELDYLRIVQQKEEGRFRVNDYYLKERQAEPAPAPCLEPGLNQPLVRRPGAGGRDLPPGQTDAVREHGSGGHGAARKGGRTGASIVPCQKNGDTKNGDTKNGDEYINNNPSNNNPSSNRSDALRGLAADCLRQQAPGEADKLLEEFLPRFLAGARGREVRNLPAYLNASVGRFLRERELTGKLKRDGTAALGWAFNPGGPSRGRAGGRPFQTAGCSYDLRELEAMIEGGGEVSPWRGQAAAEQEAPRSGLERLPEAGDKPGWRVEEMRGIPGTPGSIMRPPITALPPPGSESTRCTARTPPHTGGCRGCRPPAAPTGAAGF